jgi:hypothetical protein
MSYEPLTRAVKENRRLKALMAKGFARHDARPLKVEETAVLFLCIEEGASLLRDYVRIYPKNSGRTRRFLDRYGLSADIEEPIEGADK